MEAGNNGTAHACVEYKECDWGDLISGTKEQLQAFGLGVGLAFPGELGGPRRGLRVRDPRGYPVTITRHYRDDEFFASIHFPHWPNEPNSIPDWAPFVHGVKRQETTWSDWYKGSAAALAAAGLVRVDELPGMPGMRRVRVVILPDGTMPSGALHATCKEARLPGAQTIERVSANSFRVGIHVSKEESERRRAAYKTARSAWLRHVRSLQRPARLQPIAPARVEAMNAAATSAARDIGFQGMLSRIVAATGRPSA